jgi:hypothetical protein
MDWQLIISLHYPHDRFALGFETLHADEEYEYNTFRLYLLFCTLDFNFAFEQ